MDGANVEIAEEIDEDNMSIFGALVDAVEDLRRQIFSGETKFTGKRIQRVFDANLTKLNIYLN